MDSDLLAEIKALRAEVVDLRAELGLMGQELNALRDLRATVDLQSVEYHPQIHEAISRKIDSIDDRIGSLEDFMALPSLKPRQEPQRDILRALLLAANGMWVPSKEIRRKMSMGSDEFSRLLKQCKDFVEVKENPNDRRERLLKIS